MKRVELVDLGPKVSNPNVVVGVPGAGLVGTIAASYLVEQLKLEERGYIDSDFMPPVMIVHSSKARYPVHILGKGDLLMVLSEVPLAGRLAIEIAREVASWAKSLKANLVIGVTGAPSKKREDAQGEGKAVVLGVGNDEKSLKVLKDSGVLPFEEGVISGFYASLIKYSTKNEQSAGVLLAESLEQFPDPGASVAIVESLNALFSLGADTKALLQEAEGIRLRTRELMQETQQAQQPGATGPTAGATAYR
jgi:uncharacterized protein